MMLSPVATLLALLTSPANAALVTSNLSTSEALHILDRRPEAIRPELESFLELIRRKHRVRHVRGVHSHRSKEVHLHTAPGKLDTARENLNRMVEEARDKQDLEQVKCSEFQTKQAEQIERSRQSISLYNAQSAKARAALMDAEADIDRFGQSMPALEEQLKTHNGRCATEVRAMKGQLSLITADLSGMEKILNSTSCKPSLLFVQCESFITFGSSTLRKHVNELKSNFAQQAFQQGMAPVFAGAQPHDVPESFVEESVTHHPRHWVPLGAARRAALGFSQSAAAAAAPAPAATDGGSEHVETSDEPVSIAEQQNKCAARANPDCDLMRDKMMQIMTGIADKEDTTKRQLTELEDECEDLRGNYAAQLEDNENRFKDGQTRLALGTKVLNENGEQSRLATKQFEELNVEGTNTLQECKGNIEAFQNERCAVTKIRTELYTLEGEKEVHIQDCDVSAWLKEECSKSCGGGIQRLSRTIVAQTGGGGATCPPLLMERQCNQQECPVDCVVDEWTGWSSCTASCGGGVRQRTRTVQVDAAFGGAACGESSESEVCNIESCDQDCALTEWTVWSTCSKACNSGLEERVKNMNSPATGGGACPKAQSEDRVEYKPCNKEECELQPGKEMLECKSKIDLFIAVDGSGSLGAHGWDRFQTAIQMLIGQLGSDGGVAVLQFSGPINWADFRRCTAGPKPWEVAPDLEKDCKMQWGTRFTTDLEKAKEDVKAMKWQKGQTLTSMALSTLGTELMSGRRDASPVVLVITDGRPASPERTFQASKKLRDKARVMWVPVTTYAPTDMIGDWASVPVHNNVIKVPDFETFALKTTISSLISDICPRVE